MEDLTSSFDHEFYQRRANTLKWLKILQQANITLWTLRRVISLSRKSLILLTGGSYSGFSRIFKRMASTKCCKNPPPTHQTRNTEANTLSKKWIARKSERSFFFTSFRRLPNFQIVVVFTLFFGLDVIWR